MHAWEKLPSGDDDSVWEHFERRFDFRPSTIEWPGFREPSESVTYDISHVYGDPQRYEQLTLDLCRKLGSHRWGRVLNRAGRHLLCVPLDVVEHDRCETPRICLVSSGNEGEIVISSLR